MKRIISIIAALACSAVLFAQTGKFPVVKEIVSVENENIDQTVEIVNIPSDSLNHYYLLVGSMGIGNRIVQIDVDPVNLLYIPLGNNVTDALAFMNELKTLYKEPKGTMREIQGSFKPFFPGQEMETIKVYRYKPLLTNQLQFVIEREGYERVAYLEKSDFNALLNGLKFHGKIHPSEL